MSEDTTSGTDPIPPRLTIKKMGQDEAAEMSANEGASSPPSSPELHPSPEQGMPPNKKKTARIALDQVTADPGATVSGAGLASKTIRLAPAMTGQVSALPLPSVGKVMTGMLVANDAKRKTSRISLDSVLPQLESAGAGGDATPKTIKIKRPSFAPSANVRPVQAEESAVAEPSDKSRTARVDMPQEAIAAAAGQQTQKKTIKIRRSDGGGSDGGGMAPRSVNISRIDTAAAMEPSVQVAVPHWSFVLIATAAVITMCVMLYVLMAQAYPSLGLSLGS